MDIRILIADQERTFAEALAVRLEDEEDIQVVGAVRVTTPPGPWLTVATSADVIVIDGDLPRATPERTCAELSGSTGWPRVVTLSASSEPERIVNAIQAGVAAWVRKDQSLEHLLQVIRGVARGETWLPASETGNVVRLLLQEQERRTRNERLLASLTPRERTVLMCLAQGSGRREAIASQLHLSVNTVRTHFQHIMAKLGVHSTVEAVALIRAARPVRGEQPFPPETRQGPGPSPRSARTPGHRWCGE
jgi:DNA-binding NarL/FixJ family response regulator